MMGGQELSSQDVWFAVLIFGPLTIACVYILWHVMQPEWQLSTHAPTTNECPMPTYEPQPINTSEVQPPPGLVALTEKLAENAHDHWAKQRMADGWTYGPERNDALKTNPCLVPYSELPDSEKEYDRRTAMETLKVVLALGYTIVDAETLRTKQVDTERLDALDAALAQHGRIDITAFTNMVGLYREYEDPDTGCSEWKPLAEEGKLRASLSALVPTSPGG